MGKGRPTDSKLSNSVTVRVDESVMDILVKYAEVERRPLSMMARLLLEEAMMAREGKAPAEPKRKA